MNMFTPLTTYHHACLVDKAEVRRVRQKRPGPARVIRVASAAPLPALTLTGCVTVGNSGDISVPEFSQL